MNLTTAAEALKKQGDKPNSLPGGVSELSAPGRHGPLVKNWNIIPALNPVKKFEDRKKAVTCIWKEIQPLTCNAGSSEPEAWKAPRASKPKKPAKTHEGQADEEGFERRNRQQEGGHEC